MRYMEFADDRLLLFQILVDERGEPIQKNQLALTLNGAEELAKTVIRSLLEIPPAMGVVRRPRPNMERTLAIELTRNQERVDDLLRQIENSSDPDQVQRLSNWTNELVAYGEQLRRLSASDTEIQEGTLHIVRNQMNPGEEPRFVVMFGPYYGPGGPMKPRILRGIQELSSFLTEKVGIDEGRSKTALEDIDQNPTASVVNVVLSRQQQRVLGLIE